MRTSGSWLVVVDGEVVKKQKSTAPVRSGAARAIASKTSTGQVLGKSSTQDRLYSTPLTVFHDINVASYDHTKRDTESGPDLPITYVPTGSSLL